MKPASPTADALDRALDKIMGSEAADVMRAHQDALARKGDMMKEAMRTELAAASGCIADAIRWPYSSRHEVEKALVHLQSALAAAREIDPE